MAHHPLHLILLLTFFSLTLFVAPSSSRPKKQRCLHDQATILLQLRHDILNNSDDSMTSFNSINLQLWDLMKNDCCSWQGVTCDVAGRIVELDLGYSTGSGKLDAIFHLRHLRRLNLADHDFQNDQIPIGFGSLLNLTHLNLSVSNNLFRQIPKEISQLTRLVSLDLSYCHDASFRLETLIWNMSSLHDLYLDFVYFSIHGTDWGKTLANALPILRVLSLSDCLLSGPIHPSLARLTFLTNLRLANNNFSGSIPPSVGRLTRMVEMDLSFNQLSGAIPPSIENLVSLMKLELSDNQLYGAIPPSIGRLTRMMEIDLSGNQLSGAIPPSIENLVSLVKLDLSYNDLSGTILPFRNLTHLETLTLNENRFTGSLSSYMFMSRSLQELDLGNNNFTGTIKLDTFLQNLKSLESLTLSGISLLIDDDVLNFTIPQFRILGLSLCNLTRFPKFLQNQSLSLRQLNLSHNNIHGNVPTWIWNSSVLRDLDLSYNAVDFLEPFQNDDTTTSKLNFESVILSSCNISRFPNFFKHCDYLLHLDLSCNKIHGEIPPWIWLLDEIRLNISNNFLISFGKVPSSMNSQVFTSFISFDVSANKIHGLFPTRYLCSSNNIWFLDMSSNYISGLIPKCLNMLKSLVLLNLAHNSFSGIAPLAFAHARDLRLLDVNGNQLKGMLPTSLANCSSLEVMNFGNNKISDTFPFWLGGLPALKVLVLRNNCFNGPIESPAERHSFTSLHVLDLAFNKFSGALPVKFLYSLKGMLNIDESDQHGMYIGDDLVNSVGFFKISASVIAKSFDMKMTKILIRFSSLDLSNNNFSGNISEEIGNLKSLHGLNLSKNEFAGHIPSSIGNLVQLESLDLSHNKLSGEIPMQLASLTFLEVFRISYNQLGGRIPGGGQLSVFPVDSFEGNPNLCGLPLPRGCTAMAPSSLFVGKSKDFLHSNWKYVVIGYASGVVIGVSTGYMLLHNVEDEQFMNFINPLRWFGHRRRGRKLQNNLQRRHVII